MSVPSFEEALLYIFHILEGAKSRGYVESTLIKKLQEKFPATCTKVDVNYFIPNFYNIEFERWNPESSGQKVPQKISEILINDILIILQLSQFVYIEDGKYKTIRFYESVVEFFTNNFYENYNYKIFCLLYFSHQTAILCDSIHDSIPLFTYNYDKIKAGLVLQLNLTNRYVYSGNDNFLLKLNQDINSFFELVMNPNHHLIEGANNNFTKSELTSFQYEYINLKNHYENLVV